MLTPTLFLLRQIFPLESFEEGAEFVEVLSRFFVASHGHRIKSAYAQTLTHLLLRVATVSRMLKRTFFK